MLSHSKIWAAIDSAARNHGLSASGLAKRAGLDPTSFNKSKRYAPDGRPRWPSTESVAKVIEAVGIDIEEFFVDVAARDNHVARSVTQTIPVLGFARAGQGGFFDDGGFPVGQGWSEIEFPDPQKERAYALTIQGDSMLPLYRDGDKIIVEPDSSVKIGDRVVVRTHGGEVMAKLLIQKNDKEVSLQSINRDYPDPVIPTKEIDWIARIAWASQ